MKTNKKLLFTLMILLVSFSLNAQIAKWIVYPEYDNIEMLDNGLLKVTKDGKIGLLNKSGVPVLPVEMEYDKITSFYENKALLFKNGKFVAITDTYGNVKDLSDKRYNLVENFDRFYSGYLIVQLVAENRKLYYYLNEDGKIAFGPYLEAYPFSEGWACVKGADYLYNYIDENGLPFNIAGIVKDDINFVSSFYNGKAIICVKKKFYTIDKNMQELKLISIDETTDKKSLVVALGKEINVFPTDNGYFVNATNGSFYFDNFMRLTKMKLSGKDAVENTFPVETEREISSSFSITTDGELFGLSYKSDEILPPQFEEISYLEGDMAFVKSNGYFGVVGVDKNNDFMFKLNDDENIGFSHQYYTAKLVAFIPSYIKCSDVTVISNSDDCEIKIDTRTESENIEKNTLSYDCRLTIPKDLTNDSLTEHDYYYYLKYDGFLSKKYKVSISEWYLKYYEVTLSNTNYIFNDTIFVEFDLLNTEVVKDDKNNYFKNIEVIIPNLTEQPVVKKITEGHYSFKICGIDQERFLFTIKVTEVGCPAIEFPCEITVTKPKPQEKNKKASVTVKTVKKPKEKVEPKAEPKKEDLGPEPTIRF